jgi:xylulokinase
MRSPVDGLFLPLAYINGGGMCVRWFRDTLTGNPPATYDQLQAEAAAIAPGSEGLTFIPHFTGRVLPNNPYMKGSYLGLDFRHSRGHMYRAVLEAVAYEYRYYLSVMRRLYPADDFREVTTVGGGAKSPLFNQIKADVLGVRVTTFEMGEAALLGSAVIAGCGTGALADYREPIERVMRKQAEYQADQKKHAAYAPCAKAYLKAMEDLTRFYQTNGVTPLQAD